MPLYTVEVKSKGPVEIGCKATTIKPPKVVAAFDIGTNGKSTINNMVLEPGNEVAIKLGEDEVVFRVLKDAEIHKP